MLNDVVECIVRALEGADDNRVRHLATLFDLIITSLPCEDEIRAMLLKLPHVHGNTSEVQVRRSALAAVCVSYNRSAAVSSGDATGSGRPDQIQENGGECILEAARW